MGEKFDWGKPLNRKDGTLRGVEIVYFNEEKVGKPSKGIQGWAVQGDRFILNYHRDGEDNFEITLTEAALERFLDAIAALRDRNTGLSQTISQFDWSKFNTVNTNNGA